MIMILICLNIFKITIVTYQIHITIFKFLYLKTFSIKMALMQFTLGQQRIGKNPFFTIYMLLYQPIYKPYRWKYKNKRRTLITLIIFHYILKFINLHDDLQQCLVSNIWNERFYIHPQDPNIVYGTLNLKFWVDYSLFCLFGLITHHLFYFTLLK